VLVQSANSDDTRQISDVQALISRRVDCWSLSAQRRRDGKSRQHGPMTPEIPVLAYDRLITDCDLDLYMTFDNEKVANCRPNSWSIICRRIERKRSSEFMARKRTITRALQRGQDKVLNSTDQQGRDRGRARRLDAGLETGKRQEKSRARQLQKRRKISMQFSRRTMARPAARFQALSEEGLAGKILVTGQDAELSACQRIVNGTQQ